MTAQQNRLRIIVLGAGFWGRRWIKAIQEDPRCRLVAVVAQTSTTLNAVREEFSLDPEICFKDVKGAINEARADAAVVVVPPAWHYDVLMTCIEAGLHILCEKPLTATWDEAVRIAGLVKS